MTGFRDDSPLAKLNAARVPIMPVGTVWIGLNANDKAHLGSVKFVGQPGRGWLESKSVDIAVNSTPGEQNQVSEEIGLHDRERQGIVGFKDIWERSVQVLDQMPLRIIRNYLMRESRM
jgi:hypothetical protein